MISQKVLRCEEGKKLTQLVSLLEELMDGNKILVFCSSKRRCDLECDVYYIFAMTVLTLAVLTMAVLTVFFSSKRRCDV
eukprot:scaffold130480_cov54-Phaeocystis_antarctica.AAC.2